MAHYPDDHPSIVRDGYNYAVHFPREVLRSGGLSSSKERRFVENWLHENASDYLFSGNRVWFRDEGNSLLCYLAFAGER